jgi:hypothetical protein
MKPEMLIIDRLSLWGTLTIFMHEYFKITRLRGLRYYIAPNLGG